MAVFCFICSVVLSSECHTIPAGFCQFFHIKDINIAGANMCRKTSNKCPRHSLEHGP